MAKKRKKLDYDNKYRMWNVVLYPEDESHNTAIATLLQEYNCCGVLHDNDIYYIDDDDEIPPEGETYQDGDKLKPHYHFILKFKNARYRSALAKDLGITKYYFEPTESWYGSAKYLLHIGHPEKYQYDTDDLVGSLRSAVISLIDDIPVEEKYIEILNWIDCSAKVSITSLQKYCISQGYFSAMRGTYKMLIDYLYSHNEKYNIKENEKEGG